MADYDFRDVRLETINKVSSFINRIINEVRSGIIDEKSARLCLYGSQLMIQALEKKDHEVAIAELKESVAKLEAGRGKRTL